MSCDRIPFAYADRDQFDLSFRKLGIESTCLTRAVDRCMKKPGEVIIISRQQASTGQEHGSMKQPDNAGREDLSP